MEPLQTLNRSITLPFKAVYVVGLCFAINLLTAPGHWWVQWVALGFGIALLGTWARAARLLVMGALAAAVGRWAWLRWGDSARQQVRSWVQPPPPPPAG